MQLYSQSDKHVSRLAASAINNTGIPGAEEIEDGLAASKALNKSRLRRLRHLDHLMCLVLPYTFGYWTTRGYANSRTGHLADWTSRGLDNSRMPPATLRA